MSLTRDRAEGLKRGWELGGVGGLGGDGDHLFAAQRSSSRCHSHTEAERSSTLITTPTKPQIFRGREPAQLEHHLMLVAQC